MSGMRPHPEALYYHIASEANVQAHREADIVPATDATEFTRKQHGAVCLVFSALCLEAFINQEYVRLGLKPRTKKHHKKWLQLPTLLGSSVSFDRDRDPFQMFTSLIRLRGTRLVHFEPLKEVRYGTDNHDYFGDLVGDLGTIGKYFACVGEMIHELNRLTDGTTETPPFLKGEKYVSYVWATASIGRESMGPRADPDCNRGGGL